MSDIPTTRWSIVLQTRESDPERVRMAVRWLCETYWYPVYVFFRRRGSDPDAARDLTQGLFADLIEGNDFARADPTRGRFRDYILAAARHRRLNARRREVRETPLASLMRDGESRYLTEPVSRRTPEVDFEAAWARELLRTVLAELGAEYEGRGESRLYRKLVECMAGEDDARYADVAAEAEKTPGAVKMAALRLRKRFDQRLRELVASYTADEDIDGELRFLLAAVAEGEHDHHVSGA